MLIDSPLARASSRDDRFGLTGHLVRVAVTSHPLAVVRATQRQCAGVPAQRDVTLRDGTNLHWP